jgi:hypothetical protein
MQSFQHAPYRALVSTSARSSLWLSLVSTSAFQLAHAKALADMLTSEGESLSVLKC